MKHFVVWETVLRKLNILNLIFIESVIEIQCFDVNLH